MTMRIWLAAAWAVALCACAPKADGPEALVKALYEPYLQGAAGAAPPFDTVDAYTPGFKAVLNKANTYASLLDGQIIDADPIIAAQDWDIKTVTVAPVGAVNGETATVSARFDNMGHATVVPYTLQRIDGVWRIDDIGAGAASVRHIIDAALQPAGDVTAMEAPVRAVYAKYTAATVPVAPLHRWAPLTAVLRDKLKAADAMAARSGAAALDFDPVVDDKSHDLGPVAYEAVSSSIITRFDNAGEPKIVVYTLMEESGAWKIADISAPGSWDLTAKLSEAGVP